MQKKHPPEKNASCKRWHVSFSSSSEVYCLWARTKHKSVECMPYNGNHKKGNKMSRQHRGLASVWPLEHCMSKTGVGSWKRKKTSFLAILWSISASVCQFISASQMQTFSWPAEGQEKFAVWWLLWSTPSIVLQTSLTTIYSADVFGKIEKRFFGRWHPEREQCEPCWSQPPGQSSINPNVMLYTISQRGMQEKCVGANSLYCPALMPTQAQKCNRAWMCKAEPGGQVPPCKTRWNATLDSWVRLFKTLGFFIRLSCAGCL